MQSAALAPEAPAGDGDDEQHLEQAEAEMDGVGQREDAAVVLQRVDALPVEGDFLRQIEKAKLAHMGDDRAEHQQAEDREAAPTASVRRRATNVWWTAVCESMLSQASPPRCSVVRRPSESAKRAAEVPENQEARDQEARGSEVLAAHDLAFFAGFLAAIGRGFVCLVAKIFGSHVQSEKADSVNDHAIARS